jgi:ubiquinone/menaquinone biosynthesis C-methylase UbiE
MSKVSRRTDHDAVRRSYDAVAKEYLAHFADELADKPLDRALLAALIEQTPEGRPIADLGCGPGHVTSWLADHGARAVGIDLSEEMIAVATRSRPDLEFRPGDFLSLPAGDAEFGAIVALYSIIHLDPEELAPAFTEMRRVVGDDGHLLVSFHMGTDIRHRTEWWGQEVDIDFHFLETALVIRHLEEAGFTLQATVERVAYPDEVDTRRSYLWARPT